METCERSVSVTASTRPPTAFTTLSLDPKPRTGNHTWITRAQRLLKVKEKERGAEARPGTSGWLERARRMLRANHVKRKIGTQDETTFGTTGSPPEMAMTNSSTRLNRLSYVPTDSRKPLDTASASPKYDRQELEAVQRMEALSSAPESSRGFTTEVACYSRAGCEPGFKKKNQDSSFAFAKFIKPQQSLFGAFDGHGPNGHFASSFAKHHLPLGLVPQLRNGNDVTKALEKTFLDVDKKLIESSIDCEVSGTTAIVSLLKDETVHTAWVGDSKAVLGKIGRDGMFEAVDLTKDHRPTDPEEETRITESNGRVERLVDKSGEPIGPKRVWLQRSWVPGLAMSRSLGDVLAHTVGVTAVPDIGIHKVSREDQFLILATDGVWEFFTSEEAVGLVSKVGNLEEACQQLVDEAYKRWSEAEGISDDITTILVRFIHS